MSYLENAHREWHIVNGQEAQCPLDCNPYPDELEDEHYDPAPLIVAELGPATWDEPLPF